jgi:hypothetical protein
MRAAFSGREKTQRIGQLISRHEQGSRGLRRLPALHLNRTYKSNWFATLLWMLGIGVFFNTFKGSAGKLLSMPGRLLHGAPEDPAPRPDGPADGRHLLGLQAPTRDAHAFTR